METWVRRPLHSVRSGINCMAVRYREGIWWYTEAAIARPNIAKVD